MIHFQNVTLGYRSKPILENLDFTIHAGEFFGIVGANGSGKTTLLRTLLGILRPLGGSVLARIERGALEILPEGGWCDLTATPGALRFGYVPQRAVVDDIFPLSAREVVLMSRYGSSGLWNRIGDRDRELVERSLRQTGTADLAGKRFRDLSGGQKQRVLIARALASEARVLVLDEPTEGMDLAGQHGITKLIGRLRAEHGVTVIYVTHRLNELANSADRLLLLHDGQVRIGLVTEILSEPVLREIYGIEIHVAHVNGQRVVVT